MHLSNALLIFTRAPRIRKIKGRGAPASILIGTIVVPRFRTDETRHNIAIASVSVGSFHSDELVIRQSSSGALYRIDIQIVRLSRENLKYRRRLIINIL